MCAVTFCPFSRFVTQTTPGCGPAVLALEYAIDPSAQDFACTQQKLVMPRGIAGTGRLFLGAAPAASVRASRGHLAGERNSA